ncbi:MAG: hypothetical protein RL154_576 [Pseudomonadota bacterium]|jgi:TetR/AcrR family transcriptional repressor of nem operon
MQNSEEKTTTRDRLIDATFDEVYEKGFQGAALTNILAKANVHKGSMYHYFASKKEMTICAVKEKLSGRFDARYKSIVENTPPYLEHFYAILKDTSLRDFKRGCPLANLVQETSNLDEDFKKALKELYENFSGAIQNILDKALQNKELKECDTKKLALFTAASLEGAILSAKASGDEQDYLDCIDILIECIKSHSY